MENRVKHSALMYLADLADVLDLALEGPHLTNLDERMIYLGHLAQCARMFKVIYLDQPVSDFEVLFNIESTTYGPFTPNNAVGTITKEAWGL